MVEAQTQSPKDDEYTTKDHHFSNGDIVVFDESSALPPLTPKKVAASRYQMRLSILVNPPIRAVANNHNKISASGSYNRIKRRRIGIGNLVDRSLDRSS